MSPPPPLPRPAQRLHATITCQVKEKEIFFSLRKISHYNSLNSNHLLPYAWDVWEARRWDHRMVENRSCQPQRPLEPRPQESSRRSPRQQPRWTAAKPQSPDRWWRRYPPQQPQPPGWQWRPRQQRHLCWNKKEKLIQVQLFKNTDLSRFSPTPKNIIPQKY